MKNALLSVIIPVYNVQSYLNDCLNSVVNQTYQNLDIILIDDGSTDGSSFLCDEWGRKDSRIRVIHQKNTGVSNARNTGIRHSTGEYITFVDPDDLLHPEMYEIMMNSFENDSIDMVMCREYAFYKDETLPKNQPLYHKKEYLSQQQLASLFLLDFTGIITWVWNKVFKKEIMEHASFPNDYIASEDTVFIASLLKKIQNVVFLQDKLYYYRQQDSSIMHSKNPKIFIFQGKALHFQYNTLKFIDNHDFQQKHLLGCMNKIARLECQSHHNGYREVSDQLVTLYKELWHDHSRFHIPIQEHLKVILFLYFRFIYYFVVTIQSHENL